MGTLDLLLFPFVLFFRVSFRLFSVILTSTCHIYLLYNYLHTSTLRLSFFKETIYSSQWLLCFVIQLILIGIHSFYMIICWATNMVQQFINGICFELLFYWSLLGPSSRGRSLLSIPISPRDGIHTKKLTENIFRADNSWGYVKIRPLWGRLNVFSNYQVDGAYAHLGQPTIQVFLDAMRIASESLEYTDDPLRLQVPYDYIEARLKEPPDWLLARLAAMASISCCFVITVLQALSCVGKTMAGYKHGQPLPVLPRNTSRLPQGPPFNGVPGGGMPRLQVEGCQSSNTSKAHHLSQMHKTR